VCDSSTTEALEQGALLPLIPAPPENSTSVYLSPKIVLKNCYIFQNGCISGHKIVFIFGHCVARVFVFIHIVGSTFIFNIFIRHDIFKLLPPSEGRFRLPPSCGDLLFCFHTHRGKRLHSLTALRFEGRASPICVYLTD